MKKILLFACCIVSLFTACDDNTGTIGSSLTNLEDIVTVSDGTFNVTSKSALAGTVVAHSFSGALGNVKDPETNVYVTANMMSQFYCLPEFKAFPPKDSVIVDENNIPVADSCEVRLYYTNYFGDSLAVIKIKVQEMAVPMKENVTYYSDFNPREANMVRTDEGRMEFDRVYTLADKNFSDSLKGSSKYVPNIQLTLNREYQNPQYPGVKFKGYGSYIMHQYYEHPEYFRNSRTFVDHVCPGLFFEVLGGVGSMANIYLTQLNVYYSYKYKSTEHKFHAWSSFPGTEEVLQHSQIINDEYTLNDLVNDETCTYVKSPAGIYTELTLPVDAYTTSGGDVMKGVFNEEHVNDTLNLASVELPIIKNPLSDYEYALNSPSSLLMVEADSLASFFAKNKVADSNTAYIATVGTSSYTFPNISSLIQQMHNNRIKGELLDPQWKSKHPNWNKVYLVPVDFEYNSNKEISRVVHDISLQSARLKRGTEEQPIKMKVIYTRFNK